MRYTQPAAVMTELTVTLDFERSRSRIRIKQLCNRLTSSAAESLALCSHGQSVVLKRHLTERPSEQCSGQLTKIAESGPVMSACSATNVTSRRLLACDIKTAPSTIEDRTGYASLSALEMYSFSTHLPQWQQIRIVLISCIQAELCRKYPTLYRTL